MSTTNIGPATIEIARLPLSTVQGAFWKFHHNPAIAWSGKADAVKWLAVQVEAGVLTLDLIKTAPPVSVTQPSSSMTVAVDVMAINNRIDDLDSTLSQTRAGLKSILLRTDAIDSTLGQRIDTAVSDLTDKMKAAYKRMESRIDKTLEDSKPDTSAVQYEVAKAVRDAFEPFRKAVEDAGAQTAVAEASSVIPLGRKDVSDVFGLSVYDIKGNKLTVEVWDHPDAPEVDPDFIWTEPILRHLLLAERTGENLWFGGEKGTGKSETARQFAARTGRAFKRINFHKHTSAEEYIGSVGLVDGQTVFQSKDFLQAYTCPSTVILLDEVTNADPGELAPLNGFLEPNAAVSFGGQTHRRAPGVLIFAADNTFGNGDDSGRHVGTRLQNSALIDRFARVIPFTFLPEHQEADAIVRRTGCTKDIALHVLSAVGVARQKVQSAEIVDAPSIRSAMAFIRALSVLPVEEAWQTAVVARQPAESHAELNSIFTACINPQFIKDNI